MTESIEQWLNDKKFVEITETTKPRSINKTIGYIVVWFVKQNKVWATHSDNLIAAVNKFKPLLTKGSKLPQRIAGGILEIIEQDPDYVVKIFINTTTNIEQQANEFFSDKLIDNKNKNKSGGIVTYVLTIKDMPHYRLMNSSKGTDPKNVLSSFLVYAKNMAITNHNVDDPVFRDWCRENKSLLKNRENFILEKIAEHENLIQANSFIKDYCLQRGENFNLNVRLHGK